MANVWSCQTKSPDYEDVGLQKSLSDDAQKILVLRARGMTRPGIVEEDGYKVPSAVSKRIEKIAEQFEVFLDKEHGELPDKQVQSRQKLPFRYVRHVPKNFKRYADRHMCGRKKPIIMTVYQYGVGLLYPFTFLI